MCIGMHTQMGSTPASVGVHTQIEPVPLYVLGYMHRWVACALWRVYAALGGLVRADYTPCLSFRALAAAALPPQSSWRCLCTSPFLYEYLAVQGSAS